MMRGVFILGFVVVMLLLALKRPQVGILAWIWVSIMNPHRLGYGWIYEFPINDLVAAVTLLSCLIHWRSRANVEFSRLVGLLVVFYVWASMTTLFSVDIDLSSGDWDRFSKSMLLVALTLLFMNRKHWIFAAMGVLVLSVSFTGIKGGLFTIVTGGQWRVWGPPGTAWGANNSVSVAMLITIPLLLAFRRYFDSQLARWVFAGASILSLASLLGTQSRGGWVGLLGMALVMAARSRRKVAMTLLIALVLPLAFMAMSDSWKERMLSIQTYEQDASSMGRIIQWGYAIDIANERPLFGNGFDAFFYQPYYNHYLAHKAENRSVHSNYFQILGEQGYIGLVMYLAIMATAFFSFGRWSRVFWNDLRTRWAAPFLEMMQFSIVGYAFNGLTVNLAYLDMYYLVLAFGILLISYNKRIIDDPVAGSARLGN